MSNLKSKVWWSASLTRCIKTISQATIAGIGTAAVMGEVDWKYVLSASVVAGILSILTSLAGLPEVTEE